MPPTIDGERKQAYVEDGKKPENMKIVQGIKGMLEGGAEAKKLWFQTMIDGMDTGSPRMKETARIRVEELKPEQRFTWMRHDQRVKNGADNDMVLKCAAADFFEESNAENAKALVHSEGSCSLTDDQEPSV